MIKISSRRISLDAKTVTNSFLKKLKDNRLFFITGKEKEKLTELLNKLLDVLDKIFPTEGESSHIQDTENSEESDQIKELSFHNLIKLCKKIWKLLFETAMSCIDNDQTGFKELYEYFSKFAKFEELLYSTDDFYRDHTTHVLWTYFLAEYLLDQEELRELLHQKTLPLKGHKEEYRINVLYELKDVVLPEIINNPSIEEDEDLQLLVQDIGRIVNKQFDGRSEILSSEDEIWTTFENYLKYLNFKYLNSEDTLEIQNFSQYKDDIPDFEISSLEIKELPMELNESILKILPKREITRHIILAEELVSPVRCVAFLCHDLGYPLKRIKKISDSIKEILEEFSVVNVEEFKFSIPQGLKKFLEEILEYISGTFIIRGDEIKLKRDHNVYLSLLLDLESKEHGLMSAFILCLKAHSLISDFVDFLREEEVDALHFNLKTALCKSLIIKAIALHTCQRKKIETLSKLEDLLIFVDFIEEFSRMTRASLLATRIPQFCDTILELSEENKIIRLNLIYNFKKNENRPSELKPIITFEDKMEFIYKRFDFEYKKFIFQLIVIDSYKEGESDKQKIYSYEYNQEYETNFKLFFDDTGITDASKKVKREKKILKRLLKKIYGEEEEEKIDSLISNFV